MWRYLSFFFPILAINGLLPFCLGLFPGYYGWSAYSDDNVLREQGEVVEAHITERVRSLGGYTIKYSFIDRGGIEHKFEKNLGGEFNEMVNNKDYFMLVYMPTDPSIQLIGDKSAPSLRNNLAYVAAGLALLLCGYGMWGIVSQLWQFLSVWNLFRKGKVGSSTVGEWVTTPSRFGPEKNEMTFHFVAANGRWYEGRSRPLGKPFQQKWPKGAHIRVVYDGIKPTVCEPDIFQLIKDSTPDHTTKT